MIIGKKHTLKNIGKKSVVINYTKLSNGLIVKNQRIRPDNTVTIHYRTGTFYTASHSQIQTIEIIDLPLKNKSIITDVIDLPLKNKSIITDIIEDQNDMYNNTIPQNQDQDYRDNETQTPKILVATLMWQRFDLFTKFVKHYHNLGLDVLAIGSEGEESKKLCDQLGCAYIEHPNQPLGSKLNRRIDYFLDHEEYSHILFLGSDNFIDQKILDTILKNIKKYDMISWSDLYFVDDESGKIYYTEGYKNDQSRKGEPVAPGRCISKKVIRQLRGQVWDQYIQRSPDFHAWLKLKKIQKQIILSCKEVGGVIMDVKTKQNVNSFQYIEKHNNIKQTDKSETLRVLSLCNELNLSFIKNNSSKYNALLESFDINNNKYTSKRLESTLSKMISIVDVLEIYKNQSFSHEIITETNITTNIVFSQILPLFRAKEIAWLVLESLSRQENINFNWELVILEENFESYFGWDSIQEYVDRLSKVGCKRIKYVGLNKWIPLSAKWFFLVNECSETSELIGPNSADIYCHKNRLKTQHDTLMNSDANWYKISSNIVYDISQDKHVKFISPNPDRTDTVSSASKINLWKNIPLDCVKINVDGWRYNTMNQKNELVYYYDETSDLSNGSVNVNGINNLSYKRSENIEKVKPPLHTCCIKLDNHLPDDIVQRLKSLKDKVNEHKKICENSEINLRKNENY
jgi:hypothetical protein